MRGHQRASVHPSQRGDCGRSTPAGRGGSGGGRSASTPWAATGPGDRARSDRGSISTVRPSRFDSRFTCVSTKMAGWPKAVPSTTFAVFRPTPGSAVRLSMESGTWPRCSAGDGACHRLDGLGLLAEEPRPLDQLLDPGRLGRGQGVRRRELGEQRRRHLVDHLVGALGRQDGGDDQLPGRAMIELAPGVGIASWRGRGRSPGPGSCGQRRFSRATFSATGADPRGPCRRRPARRPARRLALQPSRCAMSPATSSATSAPPAGSNSASWVRRRSTSSSVMASSPSTAATTSARGSGWAGHHRRAERTVLRTTPSTASRRPP